MSTVNKLIIVGTVGTINEVKGSAEMPVLSFSVATSDYVGKGKGEPKQDGSQSDYATTWHDVTAFGKTASSLATRMGKGDKVFVEGPVSKETYQKKDGSGTAVSFRLKANTVTIITSKSEKGAVATPAAATATDSGVDFSSIPF